jgi:hypothetical protein
VFLLLKITNYKLPGTIFERQCDINDPSINCPYDHQNNNYYWFRRLKLPPLGVKPSKYNKKIIKKKFNQFSLISIKQHHLDIKTSHNTSTEIIKYFDRNLNSDCYADAVTAAVRAHDCVFR